MSTGKEQLEADEDFSSSDQDEPIEPTVVVAKLNLAKRRMIDEMLEKKRLEKDLEDLPYDF